MEKKYKAIVLVLASDDESLANTRWVIPRMKPEWKPLFPYFKKIWESYMFENPNIKVLFVYGKDPNIERKNYDLVYDVVENNHPGMITKTLYAFKDIDATYDYDFLIRTNLSTFWDLHALETRLDKLPKQQCLVGTKVVRSESNPIEKDYVSGFDMVLSRDLVTGLIPHTQEVIDQKVWCSMEDLSICLGIHKYLGVDNTVTPFSNSAAFMSMKDKFDLEAYKRILAVKELGKLDHYRVKHRQDRNIDKEILLNLLKDTYGKTLL